MKYDKQLFLIQSADLNLSRLTPFYRSVLQAWQVLKIRRAKNQSLGMWVFKEPLFCNDFLQTRALQSASTSLRRARCTKLGHLTKLTALPENTLREKTKISSKRLISKMVAEVHEALPARLRALAKDPTLCEQWCEGSDYSFPALSFSPVVEEWREREGQLLSFTIPNITSFHD